MSIECAINSVVSRKKLSYVFLVLCRCPAYLDASKTLLGVTNKNWRYMYVYISENVVALSI